MKRRTFTSVLISLVLVLFMAMPVFAQAAVEDAKAEARAEVQAELDEALAQVEYWKNYEPY